MAQKLAKLLVMDRCGSVRNDADRCGSKFRDRRGSEAHLSELILLNTQLFYDIFGHFVRYSLTNLFMKLSS